jgi:hypothetical protein
LGNFGQSLGSEVGKRIGRVVLIIVSQFRTAFKNSFFRNGWRATGGWPPVAPDAGKVRVYAGKLNWLSANRNIADEIV